MLYLFSIKKNTQDKIIFYINYIFKINLKNLIIKIIKL